MNAKKQLLQVAQRAANTIFSRRTASVRPNLKPGLPLEQENLEIKIDGAVEQYPLVWLRDNCTCAQCFHKLSRSRIINWNEFNVEAKAKTIEQKSEREILIRWDDDHTSVYPYDWLKSRSFSKNGQQFYLHDVYQPKKKLWKKNEFLDIMHVYDYNDVMNNKMQLCNWLNDLAVYGVTKLENAPTDEKEGRKMAEKIAFIRKTHYGEDYHIKAKPGTQNVAYLSSTLQLHTDLPYYNYKPGANFLHCIVQTPSVGGENLLTDVYYVAEKLRSENKEAFEILTTTDINWSDIGEEDGVKFHKIIRAPMIRLDKYGNIAGIRHSIPQRDSHFTIDLENVKPWYRAMKIFVEEIYENAARFKLKPGDILGFDNTRLVHGRTAYQDTDDNQRFLIGIFIDWDEIYSQLRVLKGELGLFKYQQ